MHQFFRRRKQENIICFLRSIRRTDFPPPLFCGKKCVLWCEKYGITWVSPYMVRNSRYAAKQLLQYKLLGSQVFLHLHFFVIHYFTFLSAYREEPPGAVLNCSVAVKDSARCLCLILAPKHLSHSGCKIRGSQRPLRLFTDSTVWKGLSTL